MNLFPNPKFENSFLKGGSTASPIAGTALETAYTKPLNQAKITEDNLMQSDAVTLKNTSLAATDNSNNDGLSGNVFTATKAVDTIDGFIVNSPNDILLDGDSFPRFLKNQIARVAVIGSGATIYLPANANMSDVSVTTELKWDVTNNELSTAGTVALPGVRLGGQVVTGVIPEYDATNNVAKTKNGLVVKVIL